MRELIPPCFLVKARRDNLVLSKKGRSEGSQTYNLTTLSSHTSSYTSCRTFMDDTEHSEVSYVGLRWTILNKVLRFIPKGIPFGRSEPQCWGMKWLSAEWKILLAKLCPHLSGKAVMLGMLEIFEATTAIRFSNTSYPLHPLLLHSTLPYLNRKGIMK